MNNIKKGQEYEIYINNFLNSLEHVKISYLWKDIPDYVLFDYQFINSYNDKRLLRKTNSINKLQDIGTDIIYIIDNEECTPIVVQCKNYSENNTIRIDDLSGFFFIMCKHIDKIGEIYYSNKICNNIINEFNSSESRIKLIKKDPIDNLIVKNNIIEKIKLYDYQIEAIKLSKEYYTKNNSAIINIPCGTGKTLIAYHISLQYKIVIMITPLKQYAKQNCDRFSQYDSMSDARINRKILLIDSDREGIRDPDLINKEISLAFTKNKKLFLSVTFDSCDIINELNFVNNNEVFIIFDEFHNFSKNNIYNNTDNIYKLINNTNFTPLEI
jgi:predicted helicase